MILKKGLMNVYSNLLLKCTNIDTKDFTIYIYLIYLNIVHKHEFMKTQLITMRQNKLPCCEILNEDID